MGKTGAQPLRHRQTQKSDYEQHESYLSVTTMTSSLGGALLHL